MLVKGYQKFPLDVSTETFSYNSKIDILPKAESHVLQEVLNAYRKVFDPPGDVLPEAKDLPEVEIKLQDGDNEPIRQRAYRLPFSKREVVDTEIEKMLTQGIIQHSTSPWASPITLVPKKDGTTRFCVDYRKLNSKTIKDAHPLPNIQDIFDQLGGATIFSTLDLKSGYWQMPMSADAQQKSAFVTHSGLYEFRRMPFGLANAPAQFQRAMNKVLGGYIGKFCLVYLDDVVIFSKSAAEHARHLALVLKRFEKYNLTIKPSKCAIGKEQIELLGYTVNAQGIAPMSSKTDAIANLAAPATVKEVRSFLGMTGYYRQCIPGYASIATPLVELTRKNQPFIWGPDQEEAFQELKQALVTAPVLAYPNPQKPYRLYTDASLYAVGAILVQEDAQGTEKVIAYLSHQLSSAQRNWAAIEREAFGVVYALKKLHCYLWGSKFEIHTDHKPLTALFRSEIKNTKIQRWAVQIAEYSAPILYHRGKLNVRADMLSRIASVNSTDPQEVEYEVIEDVPTPWTLDGLSPPEVHRQQLVEFPELVADAQTDLDENPYMLQGGLLYSLAEPHPQAGVYMRLVLPAEHRERVIQRAHHDVGHQGFIKTLQRVQESYVWPGMRAPVRQIVQSCRECRVHQVLPETVHLGEMPVPDTVHHTWGIDLIGPLPTSALDQDECPRYILSCVDHLSGYAEATQIPNKKADTVWEAFHKSIVSRYGPPVVVVSDNGPEFVNRDIEKYFKQNGITHKVTTPYHPASNGKVERFNRTIQEIIKKRCDVPHRWPSILSDALYAYNTTPSSNDNLSPYQKTFGRKPTLPKTPGTVTSQGERFQNIRKFAKNAKEALQTRASKERQRRNENPNRTQYSEGDLVMLRIQHPTKLVEKWAQGYQVVKVTPEVLHVIDPKGKKLYVNRARVRLEKGSCNMRSSVPGRQRSSTKYPETPQYKVKRIDPRDPLKLKFKKIAVLNPQAKPFVLWPPSKTMQRQAQSLCRDSVQQWFQSNYKSL